MAKRLTKEQIEAKVNVIKEKVANGMTLTAALSESRMSANTYYSHTHRTKRIVAKPRVIGKAITATMPNGAVITFQDVSTFREAFGFRV